MSCRQAHHLIVVLVMLLSASVFAGGRARYGGTLSVTAVTTSTDLDPLLADTPVDAALVGLTSTPLCRLVELSRPTPSTLRLTTTSVSEVTKTLARVRAEPSPYRALLANVKSISTGTTSIELTLEGPAPALEKSLCHPALSVPIAPYVKNRANARHPEGRPYPDALALQRTDARTAERLLSQHRTHLVLGSATATDAPQLFATYVLVPKNPALRQAIEATTERADLTRFFVRPPATPMFGLLPPALGGPTVAPPRAAKPPVQSPPREVTLTFDKSSDDHRAIAEKLQVKLQLLGFRLSFRAVTRADLRATWAAGGSELMLQTVLLPPVPGAALDVLTELSLQGQARPPMPPAELELIPLCVQALGVSTSRELQHLTRDAMGLPRLDDVFLASE